MRGSPTTRPGSFSRIRRLRAARPDEPRCAPRSRHLYAVYGALEVGARCARSARFSRRRSQGADRRGRQDRGILRGDAQRCAPPDRGVHDRRQCRGGGGAAARESGSLYRVHGQPEEKRVTELQKVHERPAGRARRFPSKPTPREFRQLVERLAARPDGALLEGLVIRSLAQAVYQQTNIGHFGLALEEYAHFTSPIRRYPDLLVHRAIKAAVVPAIGFRAPLQHRRTADARRRELAARAARGRCGTRCHGLSQVPVPAAAGRRDLRGHDHRARSSSGCSCS